MEKEETINKEILNKLEQLVIKQDEFNILTGKRLKNLEKAVFEKNESR